MSMAQKAGRLREQMVGFLGNLSVCKTAQRFCLEALYGIIASHSVHLTKIGRTLNENIELIKTENRLSRQLSRKGLAEAITAFVINKGAHRIGEESLLILDPSDLAKKYAEKMQHMAQIRDGSEKELAKGYWLC